MFLQRWWNISILDYFYWHLVLPLVTLGCTVITNCVAPWQWSCIAMLCSMITRGSSRCRYLLRRKQGILSVVLELTIIQDPRSVPDGWFHSWLQLFDGHLIWYQEKHKTLICQNSGFDRLADDCDCMMTGAQRCMVWLGVEQRRNRKLIQKPKFRFLDQTFGFGRFRFL